MKYEFDILSYVIVLAETALVGIAIYLFTKYTGKLLRYFSKGKKLRRIAVKIFTASAASIWILFLLWSLNLFYNVDTNLNPVFIGVSSFLIIIFFWITGRDILAGIVFTIENSIEEGQKIYSPFVEGKIKKISPRSLRVENESGQISIIPYSKLISENISLITKESRFKNYDSEIFINSEDTPGKIRESIIKRIMLSHFASVLTEPRVNYIDTVNGSHKFRVTVSTIREDHFQKILFDIKRYFQ